jgi:ubiquinone/menaquinone biosynthesis C-methylase UbiE
MKTSDKVNYGNWVPRRMVITFLAVFCISCALSVSINAGIPRGILIGIAALSGAFSAYMLYAYWLIGRNDGELQRQLCNTLVDKLQWDGQGKALDVGTGSGRIAVSVAKKHPSAHVTGIDYWSNPWTYSKSVCERNAGIEGVGGRADFQRASAVSLPFSDGEFDAVVSNYVFHSVRVMDKRPLIKEALRVLKDGGTFAFQDLINRQFYGDIDRFYEEVKTWGLKEVYLVNTSDFVYIPVALRINHMLGNSRILYGVK